MYSSSGGGGGGYYDSRSTGGRDRYERERSRYVSPSSSHHDRSRYSNSGRHHSPSSSSSRRHRRSPSPRIREPTRHHRSPSPGPSHSRYESRERRRESPPRHDRHRDKERHSSPPSRRDSAEGERKRPTVEDNRNVLERMEKSFSDGPLECLKRCMKENTKIKIWTRNYKEVRGICTGFVLAFDKHWNVIMQDVDEIYLKSRKGKNPFLRELKPGDNSLIPEMKPKIPKEKKVQAAVVTAAGDGNNQDAEVKKMSPEEEKILAEIKRKKDEKKKLDKERRKQRKAPLMCKRHVGQIFVRGDNVVMAAVVGDTVSSPTTLGDRKGSDEDPVDTDDS